jgi:hypothetical protein
MKKATKKVNCQKCKIEFDVSLEYVGKFPLCRVCREKHIAISKNKK